jgi:hypothetical protein
MAIKRITANTAMINAPIAKENIAFNSQFFVVFLIDKMNMMPPGMQERAINGNIPNSLVSALQV